MFPEFVLGSLTIDMYSVMVGIGLISAMLMFAYLAKSGNLPGAIYKKYMQIVLLAAIAGFLSAILFQSIYDAFKTGKFEIGGMTFMGGLAGGVGVFFLLYKFMTDEVEKKYLFVCANYLLMCVVLAHFFGRIGCFLAGCCYGKFTDSPLGVDFGDGHRHPAQLYEAALLLIIFFTCLVFKKQTIFIYPVSYGAGRFIIEFFRGDDRGAFLFNLLSPSQVWSIILIIVGISLIYLRLRQKQKLTAD
jgi:phosphatidylglycerol:prolipoprotein diacylglycerol transferase